MKYGKTLLVGASALAVTSCTSVPERNNQVVYDQVAVTQGATGTALNTPQFVVQPLPQQLQPTVPVLPEVKFETPKISITMSRQDILDRRARMRPVTQVGPGRTISYPKFLYDSEFKNNPFVMACEQVLGQMQPIGEASEESPLRCSGPGSCHNRVTTAYPENVDFMLEFEVTQSRDNLIFHGVRSEVFEERGLVEKLVSVKRMQTFGIENNETGEMSCRINSLTPSKDGVRRSLTLYESDGLSPGEMQARFQQFIDEESFSRIQGVLGSTRVAYSGGTGSLTPEQKKVLDAQQIEEIKEELGDYLDSKE